MKKTLVILMILVAALLLAGCGKKDEPVAPDSGNLFTPLTDEGGVPSDPYAGATPLPGLPDEDSSKAPLDDEGIMGESLREDDPDFADFEDEDFAPEEEAPVVKTEEVPTPAPTPTATPALDLPIKDYKYEVFSDEVLGYTMSYPSHWTVESGVNTVTFTEPVSSGVPMRIAVSVKSYDEKLSGAAAKKEFQHYVNTIKDSYAKFAKGKFNNKQAFINRRAWACLYKAKNADGSVVNGYVTMANVEENKQIVALHFSCSKADYNKTTRAMFKKLMYSVARILPTATPAA